MSCKSQEPWIKKCHLKVNTNSNSSIPWLFLAIRKTLDIRGRSMLFWTEVQYATRKKNRMFRSWSCRSLCYSLNFLHGCRFYKLAWGLCGDERIAVGVLYKLHLILKKKPSYSKISLHTRFGFSKSIKILDS